MDPQVLEFIVITVMIIVVIIGVNWYKYKRSQQIKEVPAEQQPKLDAPCGKEQDNSKVIHAAKAFASRNGYEVIIPGKVCYQGQVSDFDVIVVGTFGVLAIASLGYYGQVYGNEKEAVWSQTTGQGRVEFENPIQYAEKQARLVREVLFANKIKSVSVESICVFPNKATELLVPRSTPIYRLKEFSVLLLKDKYTDDKKVNIEAVTKVLKDALEK